MLKTADLQDILHTSMGDDINATINILCLYIPNLYPSVETQFMFNEATQSIYGVSFEKYYTERQLITDMLVQVDIGSAQEVNSPKYLISAHQTRLRSDTPNKIINIAIFDILDFRKYYVEIDGERYPGDSSLMNYEENDYIGQYKDLNFF